MVNSVSHIYCVYLSPLKQIISDKLCGFLLPDLINKKLYLHNNLQKEGNMGQKAHPTKGELIFLVIKATPFWKPI